MKLKLLSVLIMCSFFACTESSDNKIVNDEKLFPHKFVIELKTNDYNKASIVWSNSSMDDDSKVLYDITISGEEKAADINLNEFKFENLKARTNYTVQIVAKSEYGTSRSQYFYFKTKEKPLPDNFTITKGDVSHETISVSWTVLEKEEGFRYYVFLNDRIIASEITDTFFEFKKLKANTEYTIKVTAVDKYNESVKNVLAVKTLDYDTPKEVELKVENIDSDKARVYWSKQEDETLKYTLSLNGEVAASEITNTYYDFTGLDDETQFTVNLVATNSHSKSVKSEITFTTLKGEIPADFNVLVSYVRTTSASVSWLNIEENKGTILYKIFLNEEFKVEKSDNNAYACEGLEPDTEYSIKVVASNEKGYSRTKEFTFRTAKPSMELSDINPVLSFGKGRTATINWNESISIDGKGVRYEIDTFNLGQWLPLKHDGKSTSYEITNLLSNTKYIYRITVVSFDYTVRKEATITFTTSEV